MTVGQRILLRLQSLGISQSELARRVKMSQPAINALIAGRSRSSTHLHKIARELQTTPAYLSGETDDPASDLPPPPPAPVRIMLEVVLPPEQALARMFEGLLRMMPDDATLDERARLLARRLPIGLSQLRDLLPPTSPAPQTAAQAPATPAPAQQS